MIVELLGSRALDINSAWCLYAGIVYDTGSFRHGVNMKRAHEAAIHCLAFPIDSRQVYNRLFSLETEVALRLFSRALSHLTIAERGRIVYMYLTDEDYKEYKADPEVASGFVNRLVMLEGAEIILFFNEAESNVIKVSLRSNTDFSVGDFASMFGGGGHTRAAGCRVEGLIEKVTERMLKALRISLDLYDRKNEGKTQG
jgi:phosphoesterase RecJ-like protein